jgi:hypothetical protein
MRSSDRLVGSPSRQCVELFHETHGGFAIWLDPFGMLDPQVAVNPLPKLGVGVNLVRRGRWRGFMVGAGRFGRPASSMGLFGSEANEVHKHLSYCGQTALPIVSHLVHASFHLSNRTDATASLFHSLSRGKLGDWKSARQPCGGSLCGNIVCPIRYEWIRRESKHESRTCRCGRSKAIVTFSDARLSSRHSAVFSGVKIDWNSAQPRTVDGCLID